jgi:ATP-dependent DNA ligase
VLHPPVEPMLAQARDTLPPAGALPGELIYQPKWDGYRALLFTACPGSGAVRLQTRRGNLVESRFPDLVDAAVNLPECWVLDGELVVWAGGGMSFEALQRRVATGGRTAVRLAEMMPAHFVAFDVLQADGHELLQQPYKDRRLRLTALFAERHLTAPWTLCPETTDLAVAREWLNSWTEVPGIEGLVIRGSRQRYVSGARGMIKIRRRNTTEAIIGGITGPLNAPQTLMVGRLDRDGVLRPVGRSSVIRPEAAQRLAGRLTPAGPAHPWEGIRFRASWGSRDPLDVALVEPNMVAEIDADTAQDRGVWRHPLRFARLRQDIAVEDVPFFGAGAVPSSG